MSQKVNSVPQEYLDGKAGDDDTRSKSLHLTVRWVGGSVGYLTHTDNTRFVGGCVGAVRSF